MITLPDFTKAFEHENSFYLSCGNTRLGKFIAHYELFTMAKDLPGAFVECGVFKGASFVRFAGFRSLFSSSSSHPLIGFDTFGVFPETNYEEDKERREGFIQAAGEHSISKAQLLDVLRRKGINDCVELIEGDIVQSVPAYIQKHPDLKISLLNLDTDIYEPAVTILECLWPRIVRGGVLILDDYGVFPGETKAVDEYFRGNAVRIQQFPFSPTPRYIIKG